jgi:hypothetical protein
VLLRCVAAVNVGSKKKVEDQLFQNSVEVCKQLLLSSVFDLRFIELIYLALFYILVAHYERSTIFRTYHPASVSFR